MAKYGFSQLISVSLLALAAANLEIRKSSKIHNGTEYIISDVTGAKAIPSIWLSDAGIYATFEDTFLKCNLLGDEWEPPTINSTRMHRAVALAIRNDRNLTLPKNDSNPFWVGAFFYDTHFQFIWEKDGSAVKKEGGHSEDVGEIDRSNFRFDYFSNAEYGLVAIVPANNTAISYIPTDTTKYRRYACAMTRAKGASPHKTGKHHKLFVRPD